MKSYLVAILSATAVAFVCLAFFVADQDFIKELGYSGLLWACLQRMWLLSSVFALVMDKISSRINIGSYFRWIAASYAVSVLILFICYILVFGGIVGSALGAILFRMIGVFIIASPWMFWLFPGVIGSSVYLVRKHSPQ